MKKLIFSLSMALSFGIVSAQWIAQTSPTTNELNTVYFTSATTGFTSGSFANIYKTTDGGSSWSSVGNNFTRDFSFYNSTYGYGSGVVGYNMKRTVDGGNTWTVITPPSTSSMWGVCATSISTAYFITTDHKVHKTTDGGASFTSTTLPGSDNLTDICFPTSTIGYTLSTGGLIIKTSNSGSSWSTIYTATGVSLYAICFLDSDKGYAAGSGGTVLKTTDGGTSWTPVSPDAVSNFKGMCFIDANHGIVVGEGGVIYHTNNGGSSWISDVSGTTNNLNSVFYIGSNTAVVVGAGGVILKNTNVAGLDEPASIAAVQIYPNPASDKIVVESKAGQGMAYEIYDVSGRQLLSGSLVSKSEIDITSLSKGIYQLKLTSGNESTVRKFVKE